jgi:hypothetical protein
MGEFEDLVADQIIRLQKATADHLTAMKAIASFGVQSVINRCSTTNDTVQRVQNVSDLFKANPVVAAYVDLAESALAGLTSTDPLLDEANRTLHLLDDNVELGALLLESGNGTVVVSTTRKLEPPNTSPNTHDTDDSVAFLEYLDSQVAAAQALSPDDPILTATFVDDLTKAWEAVITGGFRNDSRSREVQVADSCVFQDRLDQTIGILNELIGDRDLLNPAIL